ncbi:MAG: hypothetical protein HY717_09750 [Planctomycetes bacterium]|nr:hypothetical protein [Planctomycetota bacterium]
MKQWERFAGEIRSLLGKISLSQKISILLLAVIVAMAMTLVIFMSRSSDFVTLSTPPDLKDMSSLKTILDEHQIPYQVTGTNEVTRIEVPRSQAARARWLAVQSGVFTAKDSHLDWLFGDPSIIDTDSRLNQRLLESRKRTVEDTIRWSASIRDARIIPQRGPEPIYARQTNAADTASVALYLKPGVQKLSNKEANTIRTLVSGAFNILKQNIQITDDNLNNYPHLDSTAGGAHTEDEDRTQDRILKTIEGIYARIFRPTEFVVGVLAEVSREASEVLDEFYDPEKVASAKKTASSVTENAVRNPGLAPGVGANIGPTGAIGAPPAAAAAASLERESRDKKENTFENQFSKKAVKTVIPPGEVKGLSVNLVVDRAAVRRILQEEEVTRLTPEEAEKAKVQDINQFTIPDESDPKKTAKVPLDKAIQKYLEDQKKFIEGQLPVSAEKVKAKVQVSAVMFPRPEPPPAIAFTERAAGWVSDYWKDVSLGILAILGLLAVVGLMKRSLPAPLEIPTLEERILIEEDKLGRDRVEQIKKEVENVVTQLKTDGDQAGKVDTSANVMLENVIQANSLSKEKPDNVASVLRTWMTEVTSNENP